MTYTVEELLPQRPPMIFISDVERVNVPEGTLRAGIVIRETDVMYDPIQKGVPAYATLEYMAQTIGCFVGAYDLEQVPPKKPGVGFVLGTRKMQVNIPVYQLDKRYTVDVKAIYFDETIASFECHICDDTEQEVAQAILNAYRPESIEQFIKEYRE